jgi:hypothetical protein
LKKYVFIVLSVFLLLAFATLVYAEEPQIKLGGNIMVRGWYFSGANFLPRWWSGYRSHSINPINAVPGDITRHGNDIESEDASLWTTDISLTLDAKVSDNVQGFVELEIAEGEIPQVRAMSIDPSQSGSYIWGNYESKPNADLKLRQAWIQYTGSGLLGAPAGLKIGHQLLTLGEKQFLNHERFGDDALVVFVNPTKELSLAAATAKLNEGYYTVPGDDIDVYALMGTYKVDKDNTIGLFYTYFDSDDLTEAMWTDPEYSPFNGLSFQDLGVHAHGLLSGMIDYAAEVDFQFGRADKQPDATGYDNLKYSGWAVYMKGGYKVPESPLNIRASFAYGSGDDNGIKTPGTPDGDQRIKEFQACMGFDGETTIDRYVHYTQIYERTIATAALIQTLGGSGDILAAPGEPHRNTGIANTTYYNLGADLAATKDLTLSLDGFIIRASKTDGWKKVLDLSNDVSHNVGWELDFKGSYKLAKNLNYFVEAGVFKPGSFYEDTGLVDSKNTVSQVIHGLNLTF